MPACTSGLAHLAAHQSAPRPLGIAFGAGECVSTVQPHRPPRSLAVACSPPRRPCTSPLSVCSSDVSPSAPYCRAPYETVMPSRDASSTRSDEACPRPGQPAGYLVKHAALLNRARMLNVKAAHPRSLQPKRWPGKRVPWDRSTHVSSTAARSLLRGRTGPVACPSAGGIQVSFDAACVHIQQHL